MTNVDKALKYFDAVCPKVYGEEWDEIRISLLQEAKYIALINNFSENETVMKELKGMGAFDIGDFYTKRVKSSREKERIQHFPNVIKMEATSNSDSQSLKIRPSLIELTADEKAALATAQDMVKYPDEYRQRLLAAGGGLSATDEENQPNASRKLDASMVNNVNVASLFSYVPSVKLKGLENWIEEDDAFRGTQLEDNEIGVKRMKPKDALQWPQSLKAYSFILGDTESQFPEPSERKVLGLLPYYLMNGASLLPVLALDIKLGDKVLDLCAAPGGKSLAILQTCLPDELVCNDLYVSRTMRIVNILNEFVPKGLTLRDIVEVTNFNGCVPFYQDYFDKVLVDVPCLNDRHSVNESDNSIFKTTRVKERLRMPEMQAQLLKCAIGSVKPGGSVVYSTCTLSPIQNDGSVYLALKKIWQETKMECEVVDLGETVRNLGFLFKFGHKLGLRYGHIIYPLADRNFGPMYFCKINRLR